MHQDFCILVKSSFWLFSSVSNISDTFVKVLIVSEWFHIVRWHARSQEHPKFITLPWKSASRLPSPWKTKLLPFFAVFDIPDSFFEVLTVSDWFHKLPWHVRSPNTLNFSQYLAKTRLDCNLLWKFPYCYFLSFQAVIDVPDVFFEVFIISDYFLMVPWHVRSPEHLKCVTLPWKKCIKTAVSLALFGKFWYSWQLFCSPHCLWLVP